METVASYIITIIVMIPFYGLLIWMYMEPEESILVGKRWMYKEDPEISEHAIRYTKFTSMTVMIGLPIVLISFVVDNGYFKLAPVVLLIVLMVGIFRIFTGEEKS